MTLARRLLLPSICVAVLALAICAEPSSAGWKRAPVVPRIDGGVRAKLIGTLHRGARLGKRLDVFAKVGDSLTESATFAQPLGCGRWTAGRHRGLRETVRRYAGRDLPGRSAYCGPVNSFSRNSAAALSGQTSYWPLQPGDSRDAACRQTETPLACEIRLTRPAYALILLGSNDVALAAALGGDAAPGFLANMDRIIAITRARGVAPILATVPPRTDGATVEPAVESLNAALYRLARQRRLPVLNLWRALVPLPNHGLAPDGIHLSVFGGPRCAGPCDPNTCAPVCEPANFTPAGLRYGSDLRNLVTLRFLAKLPTLDDKRRRAGARRG